MFVLYKKKTIVFTTLVQLEHNMYGLVTLFSLILQKIQYVIFDFIYFLVQEKREILGQYLKVYKAIYERVINKLLNNELHCVKYDTLINLICIIEHWMCSVNARNL